MSLSSYVLGYLWWSVLVYIMIFYFIFCIAFRWILTKNYRELSKGSKSSSTSFLNIAMELKKCCNHAFLVRSPEDSELQHKSRFEVR